MDSLAVDTRNDRFILIVLGLSLVVSLGLAGWYSTWAEALVIGGLSFFGAFAVYQMMPGSLLSRMTNALALMMMVALHIHQARGMIEMHFGVFVGLAFLFAYRDWRPLLLGAVLIALHHVSFNLLQEQGAPVWVFDNDRLGWNIVFIHAIYVVADEVRALASRTYDSTKEINNLIVNLQSGSEDAVGAMTGCQHKVKETERYSTEVVERLSEINTGLEGVNGMIQQIAAAVEEQSAVSRDVAENVNHIKQASQDVTSHSSDGLHEVQRAEQLVSELNGKLAGFRVG